MYLVVGLGNPDIQYQDTYHNLGFMAVEEFCRNVGLVFCKQKNKALIAEGFVNGEKVIAAKPLTYMNNSGISVTEIVQKYKIPLENVLIIYDDFDLNKGALRIRREGSAGTHNGMKSIVTLLGSNQFPRIRIGTGSTEKQKMDAADYVLSKIDDLSYTVLKKSIEKAANAATEFVNGVSLDLISQKYNVTKIDEN